MAIVGKSGSGKTTLLNILTKQVQDFEGKIEINSIGISNINEQWIEENVAYIS